MSKFYDNNVSKSEDIFYGEDAFALQREITADNALIEDTFTRNRTDFVTISYGVMGCNQIIKMQVVTLVIGNNNEKK